jgi:acyl-CoA thioester hydrolase
MPFSAEFRDEIAAAPDDIDELGHVSNVVYVRWIQEIAVAHSNAVGWTYDRYRALGAVFVVHKHVVEYRAPAFAGDRIARLTWVESFSAATSERKTRIVRLSDDKELVRASTIWALVGGDGGRPRRIPPEISRAFAASG